MNIVPKLLLVSNCRLYSSGILFVVIDFLSAISDALPAITIPLYVDAPCMDLENCAALSRSSAVNPYLSGMLVLEFCELFCVPEFGVSGLVLSTAGLSPPPPPRRVPEEARSVVLCWFSSFSPVLLIKGFIHPGIDTGWSQYNFRKRSMRREKYCK